ncbi:MAG TPA: glycosyltransferase family 1 protein [Anaerolineae bacterium]|nr:glycosyltransferase family 1 protein [Anaerolineae bacterium]
MRILHLTPRYHPATGGGQTHILQLSEHFVRAGHAVTVLTSDALDSAALWMPGKATIPELETVHNGVRILRFPLRYLFNSRLGFPITHRLQWMGSQAKIVPERVLKGFGRLLPHLPTLFEWIKTTDETFDLVACMGLPFDALMLAGQAFAKQHNIPFVAYPLTHFGAGNAPGSDHDSQFYTMRHQNSYIAASDGLVAQTETEAAFYRGHGMADERIIVAGPGITPEQVAGGDAARFRQKYGIEGDFILHIGLLAQVKGAVDNVRAVQKLRKQGVAVELVLVGGDTDGFYHFWGGMDSAEKAHIHKLGYLSEQDKKDALAACNFFSMPSKMDSFGIVYLEAWLYEKAVIAAQTWGVMDVVLDRHNGLTVPYGDSDALALAMRELLENRELSAELGRTGHQFAQYQTWAHIGDKILVFYEKLTISHQQV